MATQDTFPTVGAMTWTPGAFFQVLNVQATYACQGAYISTLRVLGHLDAGIRRRITTQRDRTLVGVGEALVVSLELTNRIGVAIVLGL